MGVMVRLDAWLEAWVGAREPVLTVLTVAGAACAFVTAFATTWIAIQ
jgi:hypothetical protein